jgi:anti-sigma factor RsiW
VRCEEFRQLAGEFALGEIDEDRARDVEQHLVSCGACRDVADREERAENELKRVLATRKPPGLDARLMAAVTQRRTRVPVTRWERMTAFVGTLVLLLAGLLAVREGTSLVSVSLELPRFSFDVAAGDAVLSALTAPWLGWLVAFLVVLQIAGVAGLLLSGQRREA